MISQTLCVTVWSLRCASRRFYRTTAKILIPPMILFVLVILRLTMRSSTGEW